MASVRPAVAAVAIGACASLPLAATEPRAGLDVRIVAHRELIARTRAQARLELPFGQNQNGTQLVAALLRRARDGGATYVADLVFHMVFKWRGSLMECETELRVGDAPVVAASAAAPKPAGSADDPYSTEVTSFVPQEVSLVATEREVQCSQVGVWRNSYEFLSHTDVEFKRWGPDLFDPVPNPTWDHEERCVSEQVHRRINRYDYQVRVGYVPPNWKYFTASYADATLSESPPLCYAIDPLSLGRRPAHRLTATVGFRGASDQRRFHLTPQAIPIPTSGLALPTRTR